MLIIAGGGAKNFLWCINTLFLLEFKNQTVKDQLDSRGYQIFFSLIKIERSLSGCKNKG